MVQYFIEQNNLTYVFEIKYIKNSEEIFIKCKIAENFIYSSLLNINELRDINTIFKGSPTSLDAFKLILNYFNENKVFIEKWNNSKMIARFNEDIKVELKRNNNSGDNKNNIKININDNSQQYINNIEINNISNNIIIGNYSKNKNNYKDNYMNINDTNILNDFKLMDNSLISKNNYINYNIIYNTNNANNNIIIEKIKVNDIEKFNHNFNNNNINYNYNKNYNLNKNKKMNYSNIKIYNIKNNVINNEINTEINYDINYENTLKNVEENINKNNYYNDKGNADDILNYKANLNSNNIIISEIKSNRELKKTTINNTKSSNEEKNVNNNILKENKQNPKISLICGPLDYNNEKSLSMNISVLQPNDAQIDGNLKDLNGFLKLCLLKKISEYFESIDVNKDDLSKDEYILQKLKNNIHFIGDLNYIPETNILTFFKFLNNINLDPKNLIEKYFNKNQIIKDKIENYWKYLSKYEEYNNNFEDIFFRDLKNCAFDYSIISMNLLERDNPEEYEQKKRECKKMKKMILYHFSEINPHSKQLNMELKYSDKSIYGRGVYFSDSIDYVGSYYPYSKDNSKIGKMPHIGDTFSLIACEIFYDEDKFKEINISCTESNKISNSQEKEKAEPSGIIKIDMSYMSSNISNISKKILKNEYILSEKYQIFPLYTFTLKRNNYFVLFRDPNFTEERYYSKFLEISLILKNNDKNFYFESSTEKALKFLLNKKNERVILITSISKDLSGKRFVEIARKIYGFDIIVLFYSNNPKNLKWITKFPNCLYANQSNISNIYKEYIYNYNDEGLKRLKAKIEKEFHISLQNFYFDYISYPNHKNDISFSTLKYNYNFPYFRHVIILCQNKNLYLGMTKEGKVINSITGCIWDITVLDNDITLFSNGFYLDIDKNKEIAVGFTDMKKWYFDKIDNEYYFFNIDKEKNNYLSMEDGGIKLNKNKPGNNEKFKLIDVIEY